MTSSGVPETGARWSVDPESLAAALRRVADEQQGFLWFELGESALHKVADWVLSTYARERPRTWSLPPEPGPEVTALRCECHGFRWQLVYAAPAGAWMPDLEGWDPMRVPESMFRPWLHLLMDHAELIDASAVVPTPPESAPASSAQGDEGGVESPTSAQLLAWSHGMSDSPIALPKRIAAWLAADPANGRSYTVDQESAEAWANNAQLHNNMRRRIERVAAHVAAEDRSHSWIASELVDILGDPAAWDGATACLATWGPTVASDPLMTALSNWRKAHQLWLDGGQDPFGGDAIRAAQAEKALVAAFDANEAGGGVESPTSAPPATPH